MPKKITATFKELYEKLDLDDNDWINKEAKELFLKPKLYKNLKPELTYTPDNLNRIQFTCSKGHNFTPKWLSKSPPLPALRLRDGRLVAAQGVETPCTTCGDKTYVTFPKREYSLDAFVYGDEAIKDHDFDDKVLISYTFISKPRNHELHKDFESKFLALKSKLAPSVDPKNWVLHFTELNNGRKRQTTDYLRHLSQEDVLAFAQELGRLIDSYPNQLNKWNCTCVFQKPKRWKKQDVRKYKSLVFYPLLMKVIDNITCSNMAPRFHFERTGDDAWARNRVIEGKCTLMWPFLTGGIPVSNPIFEEPRESIYYEIADFVSFTVARYLYVVGKRAAGEEIEFDYLTEWLGSILYMCSKSDGTIVMDESSRFPLENFFKGTSWV